MGSELAKQMEDFREKFPMDDRAFDFLVKADAAVREAVVRDFRPRREDSHYSALVTNFVRQVQNRLARTSRGDEGQRQDHGRDRNRGPSHGQSRERSPWQGRRNWNRDADHDRGGNRSPQQRERERERERSRERGVWTKEDSWRKDAWEGRNGSGNGSSRPTPVITTSTRRRFDSRDRRDRRETESVRELPERDRRDGRDDRRGDDRREDRGLEGRLHSFRDRYPMDDKAFATIERMSPAVQEVFLSDFKPKREGDTDYSPLVMTFVRAVQARAEEQQPQKRPDANYSDRRDRGRDDRRGDDRRDGHRREGQDDRDRAQHDEGGRRDRDAGGRRKTPPRQDSARRRHASPISEFRDRFPMDDRALRAIRSSPPDVQDIVIHNFKPRRGGEGDYSALVMSFVKAVNLRQGHRVDDSAHRGRDN